MAKRKGEIAYHVPPQGVPGTVIVSIHYTDPHLPSSTTPTLHRPNILHKLRKEFPDRAYRVKNPVFDPCSNDTDVKITYEIEGGCDAEVLKLFLKSIKDQFVGSGLLER